MQLVARHIGEIIAQHVLNQFLFYRLRFDLSKDTGFSQRSIPVLLRPDVIAIMVGSRIPEANGCRYYRIHVDFYRLVHFDKFLGFCTFIDEANSRTPVKRPTMDLMWVTPLEKLFVKWKPSNKLSREKMGDMLKKAVLQIGI